MLELKNGELAQLQSKCQAFFTLRFCNVLIWERKPTPLRPRVAIERNLNSHYEDGSFSISKDANSISLAAAATSPGKPPVRPIFRAPGSNPASERPRQLREY
jgi:hypothetical protein